MLAFEMQCDSNNKPNGVVSIYKTFRASGGLFSDALTAQILLHRAPRAP